MVAKRSPAKKRATKPRELKLYRLKNPDFFDKAVAAYSEAEAQRALGGREIEWIEDSKLLRKAKRRPGVVFQKLAGMKRGWEAWK